MAVMVGQYLSCTFSIMKFFFCCKNQSQHFTKAEFRLVSLPSLTWFISNHQKSPLWCLTYSSYKLIFSLFQLAACTSRNICMDRLLLGTHSLIHTHTHMPITLHNIPQCPCIELSEYKHTAQSPQQPHIGITSGAPQENRQILGDLWK